MMKTSQSLSQSLSQITKFLDQIFSSPNFQAIFIKRSLMNINTTANSARR